MAKKSHGFTLDEAMKASRRETIAAYGRHINPELAGLLKLADMDRRYVKAEGVYLTDDEGNRCIDLTGGYGALNLGHNPPEVLAAVREAQSLPPVLLAGTNHLVGMLGATLASILPDGLTMSTFGSGGAEAVEIALKTARAGTRRKKFLACTNAYHGLSFGALSVCSSEKYCEALGPLMDHCHAIPFGDLAALEAKLKDREVAGFIVEPVQGEGGAVVPPQGYLKGAEELCRKYGTLLILDEIQTGFGRTGKMFALEHEGVVPDIITLSKSLGSGTVPVSAAVTTEEIWKKAFGKRNRFDLVISTFGGNPAACAAALKTIEIMRRDDIPGKAAIMGEHAKKRLEESLKDAKTVKEVRGKGLLLGVELEPPRVPGANMEENYSAMVITRLLNKHGVLTSYFDLDTKVLRFEPPLIVTKEQVDHAVDAFAESLSKGTAGLTLSFGGSVMKRVISPP